MPENQTEVYGCAEKAAHTAGPWTAKPTTLPDVVEVRDSEGRQLASAYAVEYTNLRPVTVEETAANARLMAAAPELLQALESLLHRVEQYRNAVIEDKVKSNSVVRSEAAGKLAFSELAAEKAVRKAGGNYE